MRKLIFGLFVIGFTTQFYAQVTQVEKLSEIIVVAKNYKYLNDVNSEDQPIPVDLLETKVATYDLKNSELYDDEYDTYNISFYIPEGSILAAYDRDGTIIRTIEKFHDVALPNDVAKAVVQKFPGWTIAKGVYLVNYHQDKGVNKRYKITLTNLDQKIKVKVDEKGNFL
jgi:hypothetical protein